MRVLSFAPLLALAMPGALPQAESGIAETFQHKIESLVERANPAVVKIYARDEHGALAGTGFFIDPAGTLYTAYSIGGDTEDLTVEIENRKYPAKRLFGDPRSGIAVVKVDTETDFLPLGDSSEVKKFSPVIALGYPLDKSLSPTLGLIVDHAVRTRERFFYTSHFRANTPVQRGQGGAPVLDLDGKVIGIVLSRAEDGAGCYALPIQAAEKVRAEYNRFGEIRPGWIGVTVTAKAPAGGADHAPPLVEKVEKNSPAHRAGLQPGDRLLSIGERRIQRAEDVLDASFFLSAGDEVTIRVQRDSETLELHTTAAEHPLSRRLAPGVSSKTKLKLQLPN